MRSSRIAQALALGLLAAVLLLLVGGGAQALPPAGTDVLPVVATANVASRLGTETVAFTGSAQIVREAPHMDGAFEVVDFEVVSMDLRGAASIGAISVTERPNDGASYVSTGEIRQKQAGQDFPASSSMDLYVNVVVPANCGLPCPGGPDIAVTHNETPFHLQPRSGNQVANVNAWPPLGATYRLDPVYGFDNDGDTLIDEDTADEDGDGMVNEDPPGGGNTDTDALTDEDPTPATCTLVLCDDDSDGSIDEDPDCVPLMNTFNVSNIKLGLCVRDLTLQIAPELPSFSVARGGPSNLHPADILGLVSPPAPPGPPPPPPPTPVVVSGNDSFAGGYVIPAVPFIGVQNTTGNTIEAGEDTSLEQCPPGQTTVVGHTAWYRYTPAEPGAVTIDTVSSLDPGTNYDTVLAVWTGDTLGPQQVRVACDDDAVFPQSRVVLDASGGTTYHIQVGGYGVSSGDLQLNVYAGSAIPTDDTMPFVRIPCPELGLTVDGCDALGGVDDLDALSYGHDFPDGAAPAVNFSVAPGAEGVQNSAVRTQRNCPAPEPQGDEFRTVFNNSNTLFLDGNGPIGTCTSAFPFGLIEGATSRDDVDALDEGDPATVDPDEDGTPDAPVYFSLDQGSPSLPTLGFTPADVLKTSGGAAPTVFAARAALGLEVGDDIDGLCLKEDGDGNYGPGDLLYFSLAQGSPTLLQLGAGPADIFAPGLPDPIVAQNEQTMGLLVSDDIDAMKCQALAFKDPNGDTDGDTIPNGTDPDDDNDGCTDVQEMGPNVLLGGQRNPHNFWDVMDVFIGSPLARDRAITAGDIAGVVSRFGSNDAGPGTFNRTSDPLVVPSPAVVPSSLRVNYHPAFDRGGAIQGGSPWNLLPPDGSISVGDIAAAVVQFGDSCV